MSNAAIKQTKGKRQPKQIPIRAVESILKVREFGNKKYEPNSFYQVPFDQHIDAAFRHLMDVFKSEDYLALDKESGLMHIEHALCDLAGAVEIVKRALDNPNEDTI